MRRKIQVLALIVLIVSICVIVADIPRIVSETGGTGLVEETDAYIDETVHEPTEEHAGKPGIKEEKENVDIRDPKVNDIDFDRYRSINEDVYAYIYIPGTDIDYPILQHESDNSYYLNHNLDGTKGYPGCIYTEKENAKDFTDPNTILYGHNMKDGTMFHDLHLFEDSAFFDENKYIYIYTPESVLEYEIFAVYTATDDHLFYLCDFDDAEAYGRYLDQILHRTAENMDSKTALVRDQAELTPEDRILSLQTCTGNGDRRTVLHAVLADVI